MQSRFGAWRCLPSFSGELPRRAGQRARWRVQGSGRVDFAPEPTDPQGSKHEEGTQRHEIRPNPWIHFRCRQRWKDRQRRKALFVEATNFNGLIHEAARSSATPIQSARAQPSRHPRFRKRPPSTGRLQYGIQPWKQNLLVPKPSPEPREDRWWHSRSS